VITTAKRLAEIENEEKEIADRRAQRARNRAAVCADKEARENLDGIDELSGQEGGDNDVALAGDEAREEILNLKDEVDDAKADRLKSESTLLHMEQQRRSGHGR